MGRARSLVRMLPKHLKDQIAPSIDKFYDFSDKELEELKRQWDTQIGSHPIFTVGGVPFGEFEQERHSRARGLIGRAYERRLEDIIEKVASVLHHALLELDKHE